MPLAGDDYQRQLMLMLPRLLSQPMLGQLMSGTGLDPLIGPSSRLGATLGQSPLGMLMPGGMGAGGTQGNPFGAMLLYQLMRQYGVGM